LEKSDIGTALQSIKFLFIREKIFLLTQMQEGFTIGARHFLWSLLYIRIGYCIKECCALY